MILDEEQLKILLTLVLDGQKKAEQALTDLMKSNHEELSKSFKDTLDRLGMLEAMSGSSGSSASSAASGSSHNQSARLSASASAACSASILPSPIRLYDFEDLDHRPIAVSALGAGLQQTFVGVNFTENMRNIKGSHRQQYTAWLLMIVKCPQFMQFMYCDDERAVGVFTLLKCQTAANMVSYFYII
jgi:hypothetical protein